MAEIGTLRIDTEINTQQFDKQIEYLRKKSEQTAQEVEQNVYRPELKIKYEAEFERLNNAIDRLEKRKINLSLGDVKNISYNESSIAGIVGTPTMATNWADGVVMAKKMRGETSIIADDFKSIHSKLIESKEPINSVERSSRGLGVNFSNSLKSVKRLAIGLLGVRGAYGILSKVVNSYLASNDHFKKQLEANWTALGTLLAPIIEWIINLLKKAVTWVLYFAQQLTGVNYIAKANAAIIKSQTKNQKKLNKEREKYVASFDEINKIQEDKKDTDTVDKGTLFNFDDLSEDTKAKIKKIADAVKPIYDMIKKIIGWCIEHPDALLAILGGATLLTMLAKIIGVAGGVGGAGAVGLLGVYSLLALIAGFGALTIYITYKIKDAQEASKDAMNKNKDYISMNDQNNIVLKEVGKSANATSKQIDRLNDKYKTSVSSSLGLASSYQKQVSSMSGLQRMIYVSTGEYQNLTDSTFNYLDSAYNELRAWKELYDQGKLDEDQIAQFKIATENFNKVVSEGGIEVDQLSQHFGINRDQAQQLANDYKNTSGWVETLGGNMSVVGKQNVKPKVDKSDITTADSKVKTLQDKLSALNKTYKTKLQINVEAVNKLKKTSYGKAYANVLEDLINFEFSHMATGGIVNNPGRGVTLGNVVAGEAGREGVIPLTDPQAMSQLGYEIGRHIVVDLTNITTLNSKEIAREQKKIDGQQAFARNGRA